MCSLVSGEIWLGLPHPDGLAAGHPVSSPIGKVRDSSDCICGFSRRTVRRNRADGFPHPSYYFVDSNNNRNYRSCHGRPGRPTLYKPEYADQAHNHCLLGATNAGLAELFDVAQRTIDSWIANIPSFAQAVREGRAIADGRVARCLYERAVGYRPTVERVLFHRGEERRITSTVQHPPDTRLHLLAAQSVSGLWAIVSPSTVPATRTIRLDATISTPRANARVRPADRRLMSRRSSSPPIKVPRLRSG